MSKLKIHRSAPPSPPRHHDWLDDLLTPYAILGIFALCAQPWLVLVRIHEFSICLAQANFANDIVITVLGYKLTACQLMGLALTLAQMVASSVAIPEPVPGVSRPRHLHVLAYGVLIAAGLVEFGLVCLAHEGIQRVAYLGMALALGLGECFAGILIFDHLVIPAILCVANALRDWFRRRK